MVNRVAGCQPPAGALLRFGLPSLPGVVGMVLAPGSASGKHPFCVVWGCGPGCRVCGGCGVGVGVWDCGPLVMLCVRALFAPPSSPSACAFLAVIPRFSASSPLRRGNSSAPSPAPSVLFFQYRFPVLSPPGLLCHMRSRVAAGSHTFGEYTWPSPQSHLRTTPMYRLPPQTPKPWLPRPLKNRLSCRLSCWRLRNHHWRSTPSTTLKCPLGLLCNQDYSGGFVSDLWDLVRCSGGLLSLRRHCWGSCC